MMPISAALKTALESVRRLTGLDLFWDLVGSFDIAGDNGVARAQQRGQWLAKETDPLADIEIVNDASIRESLWLNISSSPKLVLSEQFVAATSAAELTRMLIRSYTKILGRERGNLETNSGLSETQTALMLEKLPIEAIVLAVQAGDGSQSATGNTPYMQLTTSDPTPVEIATQSGADTTDNPQDTVSSQVDQDRQTSRPNQAQQLVVPEGVGLAPEVQAQASLAHDHEHDEDHLCTDAQTSGEYQATAPPTVATEVPVASFAELTQLKPTFVPASVSGSVVGTAGLEEQLPLVQWINVVGAVHSGSLQLSNSSTLTIQATLGRSLGSGESLRYSLDQGTSWVDVPAAAISNGTSVVISGLALPTGTTVLQMASFATGRQGQISRQAIVVDTAAPTAAISSALFNEINGELILSGTQLNSLLSSQGSNQTNLLTKIDWSKLSWQTSPSAAPISFSGTDIETVKVISDQRLLIRIG